MLLFVLIFTSSVHTHTHTHTHIYIYKLSPIFNIKDIIYEIKSNTLNKIKRRLHGLIGSVLGQRYITRGFKPQSVYIRRVFHLSIRLITYEGRSANRPIHLHLLTPGG